MSTTQQKLTREERLRLWREERKKAKATPGSRDRNVNRRVGKSSVNGPSLKTKMKVNSKAPATTAARATRPSKASTGTSRRRSLAAIDQNSGVSQQQPRICVGNPLSGPAVRLTVGKGTGKKQIKAKATAAPVSDVNQPKKVNRRRSLGGGPSSRPSSVPKHKTPNTRKGLASSSTSRTSSSNKKFPKRTPPTQGCSSRSSVKSRARNSAKRSNAKKQKSLPPTPGTVEASVACAVPLPESYVCIDSEELSDDPLSPMVSSLKATSNKSTKRTKQKKRRRRRQSICFNQKEISDLSKSKRELDSTESSLGVQKIVCPSISSVPTGVQTPSPQSTLETVLASPITDLQGLESHEEETTSTESAPLGHSTHTSPAKSFATVAINTDHPSSSVVSRACGITGRLLVQATRHRAKFLCLTSKLESSQSRIQELEARLLEAEARNERIIQESAELIYTRDNLAEALQIAEAKLPSILRNDDHANEDITDKTDVDTLLAKLKLAEKKISTLTFENEMTMQEMAEQASAFEEEMEQECVAKDMDIRAAESKAEEALKESADLKIQLQQVQLKFTGALKQALSRNAELSSQLESCQKSCKPSEKEEQDQEQDQEQKEADNSSD